jgi:quercetin dioxygenase-like cupin family protein
MKPAAIMVKPEQLVWREYPDHPGVQYANIEGDMSSAGEFITRVKFPANCRMSAHRHPRAERETIISGALYLGFGDRLDDQAGVAMTAGSVVVIPPETNHYAWTREETVVQVHGSGPWVRIGIEK